MRKLYAEDAGVLLQRPPMQDIYLDLNVLQSF